MASKTVKQMKSRWQFAAGVTLATVLCVVSAWVVLKRFTVTVIVPSTLDPLPAPISEATKATGGQPTSTPNSATAPAATPTQQAELPLAKPVGALATRQGVFRIGNPTSYPVRVALLSRKASANAALSEGSAASSAKSVAQPSYEVPAHWDFAPEEGGAKGLLVSLPDRTLKLKKGDVLVAFAQDGSGRYWGPYVVDETAVPTWDAKAVEWQLILQP
ncbi:hypothetical protein [Stenomitos frigidus]|uniref:Uncharacterized protein n=1 Tax=Stenomitos frigidus ULC18 TaxID=2107698 RepID=A0A2T1DV26_9CYAN|nr:hypothetical protein [Stenomitos frigidus]PSB24281.1 hypothetical protein C7B82_27770 [Stenomitos frigidus ULC18]